MRRRLPIHAADLRGAARLATEATAGVTDLVEALHERIRRLPGVPAPARAGRTDGLTGLVYRSVRGITQTVGAGVDAVLGGFGPPESPASRSPRREALLAALNGVLGDHLAATGNPLALPMTLRHRGQALWMDAESLAGRVPEARPNLLVLVHGLCLNDLQWARRGRDPAALLGAALDCTPVHLHYNTGLPIWENGRAFAAQLEQLLDAWPHPLQRLALLGHSMGGLVIRSAVAQARREGLRWPERLRDMVFLGTPHHGAPLERLGHGIDSLLARLPYAAPFARLGRLRSAGITDLRHGRVLEEGGHGVGRRHLPLPDGVRCAAVAGLLDRGGLKGRLLGDGLVPRDSALGRHRDPARTLAFAPGRTWVGEGLHHLDLLDDPAVLERVRAWLSEPDAG